jgi:SAM-dependent methyltransferase
MAPAGVVQPHEVREPSAQRCAHCASQHVISVLRWGEHESFHCQDCGGLFNRPGEQAGRGYDQAYYDAVYVSRRSQQLQQSRRYVRIIRQFVPGGSVLDFGCGTGIFLAAAVEAGFTANVGADTSADGLRLARQNVDDSVTLLHLPQERLPERRFEVIALMDTLSAIPEARGTLLDLKNRYLADAGVLVIRTPDITYSYFLTVKVFSWFVGKKHGIRLTFADSRYALFDVAALRRFLESTGFETVFSDLGPDYHGPAIRGWSPMEYFWWLVRRVLRRRSIFVIARSAQRRYPLWTPD